MIIKSLFLTPKSYSRKRILNASRATLCKWCKKKVPLACFDKPNNGECVNLIDGAPSLTVDREIKQKPSI